jgi:hypothetical protein
LLIGQGINAIIFYAPVLFEGIAGGNEASLLNTVIVNVGEWAGLLQCCWSDNAHR